MFKFQLRRKPKCKIYCRRRNCRYHLLLRRLGRKTLFLLVVIVLEGKTVGSLCCGVEWKRRGRCMYVSVENEAVGFGESVMIPVSDWVWLK